VEKVYTAKEVAARLGVSPQSITLWIRKGQFPNAYRLNPDAARSPHRIPESDIIAFEKKRQRKTDQE